MPDSHPCHVSFDARSVMLFAALAMGAATLQAQTSPISGLRASGTPAGGSGITAQATIHAAFERADTNQDGGLSPTEAALLPAIDNRFQEIDKDKDGSLSRAEFQAGAAE